MIYHIIWHVTWRSWRYICLNWLNQEVTRPLYLYITIVIVVMNIIAVLNIDGSSSSSHSLALSWRLFANGRSGTIITSLFLRTTDGQTKLSQ